METKHTPGPWHLDDEAQPDYVFSRDMKMIATLRGEGDELPLIANARLIAAAPDLLDNKAGWIEYKRRVSVMVQRQGRRCCLCEKPLALGNATFEHQRRRGMGAAWRDDRITKDGEDWNGAAHWVCNGGEGLDELSALPNKHLRFFNRGPCFGTFH